MGAKANRRSARKKRQRERQEQTQAAEASAFEMRMDGRIAPDDADAYDAWLNQYNLKRASDGS